MHNANEVWIELLNRQSATIATDRAADLDTKRRRRSAIKIGRYGRWARRLNPCFNQTSSTQQNIGPNNAAGDYKEDRIEINSDYTMEVTSFDVFAGQPSGGLSIIFIPAYVGLQTTDTRTYTMDIIITA